MNKKGVGLLGMLAILFVIFMGIFFLFKSGEFFANSTGIRNYDMSKWSGNEFMFESDLHFLENSLWITCKNLAYENGRNGTIFDEPWDMVSGMVCWNCKKGIPPEDLVAIQLLKRVNQTYEKYFDKISIKVENHTNLNMTYDRDHIKFFYKGNFSYHPSVDFYTNASNVWINATTPLRYFLLYDKAKEFVENEKINETLRDAMNETTVCKSSGEVSEDEVRETTEKNLSDVAEEWEAMWPSDVGINLTLVQLDNYNSIDCTLFLNAIKLVESISGETAHKKYDKAYCINFTYVVNSTVYDKDDKRMIPTEDGMKKLSINFGLNKSISFLRYVEDLSSGYLSSQCNSPGSASCVNNKCYYWINAGSSDDCSGDCYVKDVVSCDCATHGCANGKGCYKLPYDIVCFSNSNGDSNCIKYGDLNSNGETTINLKTYKDGIYYHDISVLLVADYNKLKKYYLVTLINDSNYGYKYLCTSPIYPPLVKYPLIGYDHGASKIKIEPTPMVRICDINAHCTNYEENKDEGCHDININPLLITVFSGYNVTLYDSWGCNSNHIVGRIEVDSTCRNFTIWSNIHSIKIGKLY